MPETVERSERLHPEVRALLAMMDSQPAPPLESQDPIEARNARLEGMKMMGGPPAELGRVEDLKAPGPNGDVPVRLYANNHDGIRPALVYFHGGGFVFGSVDTHDAGCRALARESDAIVISVEYGLSPENKFPSAVNEAHAATKWVAANAARLGIDARRICVGGDSAGGNLAVVVAVRCRDAGGPALAGQVLFYPLMDFSSADTESHREFGEGYFLTRGAMDWFTGHYLASPGDASNPEASPRLTPDVAGLPPALVITAEFDPLRDEGEAYGARLKQAGVPVTVSRYPGMIHAFASMTAVLSAGRDAIKEAADFVARTAPV